MDIDIRDGRVTFPMSSISGSPDHGGEGRSDHWARVFIKMYCTLSIT